MSPEAEKRLWRATKNFGAMRAEYPNPDDMLRDIEGLLRSPESERETSNGLRRSNVRMRNALPELLASMGDLQKKYAFSFRDPEHH